MVTQSEPFEDLPQRQSVRNNRGNWDNRDNAAVRERRKVLQRILESSVGQRWDSVYSHILSKFKRTRTADRHCIEALSYLVEQGCVEKFVNGKKVVFDNQDRAVSNGELFVHPATGLLQKAPESRSRKAFRRPAEVRFIKVGKAHYRKIGHVWYEITMSPLPDNGFLANSTYPGVVDVVVIGEVKVRQEEEIEHRIARDRWQPQLTTNLSRWDYLAKYGSYSYASAKRQLRKKELKSLIYPRIPKSEHE